MNNIIIIGGGGHAKVCISILKKISSCRILGYIALEDNGEILGIPYLGNDQQLEFIKKENPQCAAVIGVGNVELSNKRKEITDQLKSLGFELPIVVSPTAIVNEDVQIEEGTIIFDGVIINSGARIGACAIINTGSIIEHDCQIDDFVHIASGVSMSGGVKVGQNSLVGIGSSIIQNITIGNDCFIGAKATVIEDCLHAGTYLGTPARLIK